MKPEARWPVPSAVWKALAWILLALPLAVLGYDIARELNEPGSALGADPQEAIMHRLGAWGLRLLLVTLAISSLARLARRPALVRLRRLAGLWAFAYLALHLGVYVTLLAELQLAVVAADLYKRPYITAGSAGLLALVPLAVTSTRGWQRRLGRRWKALHRLIYPAALAGWIHLLWLSKASYGDAILYGVVLAALLGERVLFAQSRRRGRRMALRTTGRDS